MSGETYLRRVMSKQLTIAAALSVFATAALALAAPQFAMARAVAANETGATTVAAAPASSSAR